MPSVDDAVVAPLDCVAINIPFPYAIFCIALLGIVLVVHVIPSVDDAPTVLEKVAATNNPFP